MVLTVNAFAGRGVYELDGCALVLKSYEAHLTPDARQAAQRIVAFQAVMDTLACALRWHGQPQRVSA